MKRVITEMHMEEVTICYGMTETSPVSTQTAPSDELQRRVGTVGRVHPHVEIKLVDPATGRTVQRGKPGELCTRGYSVMLGYWQQPADTAEAIDRAGWMHTGDLATMDEAGYVRIVGRSKDMIIRGGENVYPREIEEFLHTYPGVADVQVVGIPDEHYGEDIVAFASRGRRAARRGRAARTLPHVHRPLQDPPPRTPRHRVPDDGHRKGPEVQAPPAGNRRADRRAALRHVAARSASSHCRRRRERSVDRGARDPVAAIAHGRTAGLWSTAAISRARMS
jgi:hypothetical protein